MSLPSASTSDDSGSCGAMSSGLQPIWSEFVESPPQVAAADPESYKENVRFVVAIDEMPEGAVPDRRSHQDLRSDRVTSKKSWLHPGGSLSLQPWQEEIDHGAKVRRGNSGPREAL